jgi:UV DNA damage repair endonuclease
VAQHIGSLKIQASTKRIGFCCKWIDHPEQTVGIKSTDPARKYNTGTTTIAWLNRQSREVAEQKLWDLMVENIASTQALVERVSELPKPLRMVRLSSDILPCYTHADYRDYWMDPSVVSYAETHFARLGSIAKANDVRLSFHPGQFTVLASSNPGIVERSIEEFEYHANMARWMGYGRTFQDFKINVHISGREGPEGIRRTYSRLSPEARNCITIENEEITHGIEHTLSLSDIIPTVLDIHHHWIREGEYIDPRDDRCKRVTDSWRGHRPVIHYSCSREDVLTGHDENTKPDHALLLEAGFKKQKLRAHSDFYWNRPANEWALSFWPDFDIQCESKGKNLASFALYEQAKALGL